MSVPFNNLNLLKIIFLKNGSARPGFLVSGSNSLASGVVLEVLVT